MPLLKVFSPIRKGFVGRLVPVDVGRDGFHVAFEIGDVIHRSLCGLDDRHVALRFLEPVLAHEADDNREVGRL